MDKDIYALSNRIVRLNFIEQPELSPHTHEDIQLFYVIQGTMNIHINKKSYDLSQEDMIMVNPGESHHFSGNNSLFLGQFIISYQRISTMLNQNLIYFACNSTLEKNEAFKHIRSLINHILSDQIHTDSSSAIYSNSLYYQLLHLLTSHFLLTEKDIRFEFEKTDVDNRMQEILHFLRTNYKERLTLQDLSDSFFLSTAYLSKYIKTQSKLTFLDLITEIRLNHAIDDLVHTDTSIMKIAMKNGFASVSAFNKSFKEKHGCTPSEYQARASEEKQSLNTNSPHSLEAHKEKIHLYLDNKLYRPSDSPNETSLEVHVNPKYNSMSRYVSNSRLINIGTLTDLNVTVFKDHIRTIKSYGFKYIRLWDIFSEKTLIDHYLPDGKYNYARIDAVLDFILEQDLIPYLELEFKPKRLLRTTQNALLEVKPNNFLNTIDEIEAFFESFGHHLARRYGEETVEKWYFEYWKKDDVEFINLKFNYTPVRHSMSIDYIKRFTAVAKGMKRWLPNVKLGGGGFSVQHYGRKNLVTLFNEWSNEKYVPAFISINCYPYQIEHTGSMYFEKKNTDMFFLNHNIEITRDALRVSKLETDALHVSEYNLTLSNRNIINDSCQKAAFLVQTLISTIGACDLIGYWFGTDIYADLSDTNDLLFGGSGLLSKKGIPKASAYAYQFMNKLSTNVLKKEKNYVITGNEHSWKIACHNFKNLSYSYYLKEEDEIHVGDLPYMIEDSDELKLSFHFEMIEDGTYTLKQHIVNSDYGNIQKSFSELPKNYIPENDELKYIASQASPKLKVQTLTATKNTLQFEVILEPNEVQYIHIEMAE